MTIEDVCKAIAQQDYDVSYGVDEESGQHFVVLYPADPYDENDQVVIKYDGTVEDFFDEVDFADYEGDYKASLIIGEGGLDFDDMRNVINREEDNEDSFLDLKRFLRGLAKESN